MAIRRRWRKAQRTTGLAAIGEAGKPDSYEFWRGGEHLLTVAACWQRYTAEINGWYWYGLAGAVSGKNSLNITGAVPTMEQAKSEALNFLKARECSQLEVTHGD